MVSDILMESGPVWNEGSLQELILVCGEAESRVKENSNTSKALGKRFSSDMLRP